MVIPLSRSALSLSKQAYLKELLPVSATSFVLSDNSLVDTSTLVDQVSSGRGFTGVDVSDNDKGNVRFLVAWHCLKDFENYFFFFLVDFVWPQVDFWIVLEFGNS